MEPQLPSLLGSLCLQSPDSGPELSIQDSDNVNFDGPKGCYERKARSGLFQISLDSVQANRHFDLKKYVDGETQDPRVISKEAGANSMECQRTSLSWPKTSV